VSQESSPSSGSVATPDSAIPDTHPKAIYFFFWGELAERSSYYGMRAILMLYMTTALHYAVADASPIYAAFKMACYFLPLVGGFVADRWIGRYWTIVGFSVPYVLGHFILGFSDPYILGKYLKEIPPEKLTFYAHIAMFVALALLAGGSGVIKPNISSLLGQTYDQKRPGKERLRSAAFLWFYLSINVGALVSQFALPEVRQQYILAQLETKSVDPATEQKADALLEQDKVKEALELLPREMVARKLIEKGDEDSAFELLPPEILGRAYQIAFMFPTILMAFSLVAFAVGKRTYAVEVREHRTLTPEERQQRFQTLVRLFGIFGLVILFWFGYEHNDSLWVAFTKDYVNLKIPFISKPIAADQLQFLNDLFVIILVPTFNVTFKYLDPDIRIFTQVRKVLAGFILTAAAIAIMSAAGYQVQGHIEHRIVDGKGIDVCVQKVSYLWPAMAYIVLTFGEVLLYGTMLDLSYSAAPKNMKGFVTACFLVTNTLANFLNIFWTPLYGGSLKDDPSKRGPLSPGMFFALTAAATFAAAVGFIFVGRAFEKGQKTT
jgi:POT family proton-dependent oligopeptide transporter